MSSKGSSFAKFRCQKQFLELEEHDQPTTDVCVYAR
jgi:hypothetical protein